MSDSPVSDKQRDESPLQSDVLGRVAGRERIPIACRHRPSPRATCVNVAKAAAAGPKRTAAHATSISAVISKACTAGMGQVQRGGAPAEQRQADVRAENVGCRRYHFAEGLPALR